MPPATTREIRPVWYIRFLAGLVFVIAGLPSTGAIAYLLFHPAEAIANWPGALLCLAIATIVIWGGFRWFRLGGRMDQQEIVLNGMLRTYRVPLCKLHKLRTVRVQVRSLSDHGDRIKETTYLLGADDEQLAVLPESLRVCRGYAEFKQTLEQTAARSRQLSGTLPF